MEASPPPPSPPPPAAAAGIDFSDLETCQRHGWVQQEANPVCYVRVQTDDGCQRVKCGEMGASPPPPPPAAAAAEIAFFDVETTIPSRAAGTRYALLEFGAILVCPRRLVEVGSYSTLIRPADPSSISLASVRCNGITPDSVASAPSFRDVADNVYAFLHGRVWAGHNIVRFDCARIREAFADIGRPAPEAKGMIDTLPLLTQRFGRRAGDMKMASLATYFGLGQQKHRSLDDVRMNLEVLKYCATVLFLESSLPDMYSMNGWVYENNITRNKLNGNTSPEGTSANLNSPSDLFSNQRNLTFVGTKTILEINNLAGSSTPESNTGPSDLISHIEEMKIDPLDRASAAHNSAEMFSTTIATPEGSSGYDGFLEPYEVSTGCISATQAPSYQCGRRIVLLHRDAPLQLCGMGLRVQFGISSKFVDYAGRPKLSIVVDVPANLCQIFDACDHLAHRSSLDSGSSSEWRPVMRKNGYSDSSFVRLNIPTAANGDGGIYATDIYLKEQSGSIQRLVFSRLDAAELDLLFVPGSIVDAYFSFDVYDYQNSAGIRLVAKRLVVHSK